MKFKKNKNLLIIFVVLLFLIPLGLSIIHISPARKQLKNISPTQKILQPTNSVYVSPTHPPANATPTKTVAEAQQDLVTRFDNRKQLSATDIQAKQRILSFLPAGETSGTIYQTANIQIEYNDVPDIFQVEVFNKNIDAAKSETVAWFKSQGMSQDGICYAPVQFYASFDLLQELKQENREFNPLAPGC